MQFARYIRVTIILAGVRRTRRPVLFGKSLCKYVETNSGVSGKRPRGTIALRAPGATAAASEPQFTPDNARSKRYVFTSSHRLRVFVHAYVDARMRTDGSGRRLRPSACPNGQDSFRTVIRFAQNLLFMDSRYAQTCLDKFKIKLAMVQSNIMS